MVKYHFTNNHIKLKKMKIAIPTRNNAVDDHFGHCEYYTIFTEENNTITKKELFDAPQGCGCKSNIATLLKQMDVSIMLAGNMGMGALNVLASQGIRVIRGCSGNVDQVIVDYIKGNLNDSGVSCSQHGEDHQCSH
ncbi:MAG: NifB/NifX family molybdenum-iron cluster-binding protein [Bacteroidales bacterium]|nr:NifB/NifX family molybdenum-iron cluster-binding protein [Bacteroidales bacterium]